MKIVYHNNFFFARQDLCVIINSEVIFTHRFWIILTSMLFFCVSVMHLVACYRRYPKLRSATKVLLIPLLCALYCSIAQEIRLLVIAALLFGWIGDVFLLLKGKQRFMLLGIVAFAFGHICYIAATLTSYRAPLRAVNLLIPIALCVLWMVFVSLKLLPSAPKSLRMPGFCYALLLSGTCLSALYQSLSTQKDAFLIAFIGGLFFIISDTILTGQEFRRELKHGNFYVMLTYIIAQTLLVIGLAQTGGV